MSVPLTVVDQLPRPALVAGDSWGTCSRCRRSVTCACSLCARVHARLCSVSAESHP